MRGLVLVLVFLAAFVGDLVSLINLIRGA